MLRASYAPRLSDQDQLIFDILVSANHYLRQVNAVVDFERYRDAMATCYSATDGRPADDPVVLLKIGFLQTHYNLSDREVLSQIQVNVAFRYFLNLALTDALPHSSLLTVFRARLGTTLYQQIFDGVVAQARVAGLVKDRLRLKDATHIIANIAIPSTIRLIAQMRQRLLATAEPFAPEQVGAERAHALAIRRQRVTCRMKNACWHESRTCARSLPGPISSVATWNRCLRNHHHLAVPLRMRWRWRTSCLPIGTIQTAVIGL
jgi:transposase